MGMFYKYLIILLTISVLATPQAAKANHGPATTGGGSSTVSGETLKQGSFVFSLDESYTNFENVSQEEAESEAMKSGEFDALRDAYVTNLSVAYGISDDFQIEGQIGWYSGRGFIDAHAAEEEEDETLSFLKSASAGSATGNPEGLTDLAIRGKYRLMKGAPGNLSVVLGGIIPTGKDDELLSDGDPLEPSSQPGTGEFGIQSGLAYSRYLTTNMTMDASAVYTYRFEDDGFQVGDRLDTSIAFAYRFTESVRDYPQVSVFGEVTNVYIGKDESDEEGNNPNSGGNTLFLTPGVRLRFTEQVSFSLAPSIPVLQDLNGNQLETDFRVMGQLTVGM